MEPAGYISTCAHAVLASVCEVERVIRDKHEPLVVLATIPDSNSCYWDCSHMAGSQQ